MLASAELATAELCAVTNLIALQDKQNTIFRLLWLHSPFTRVGNTEQASRDRVALWRARSVQALLGCGCERVRAPGVRTERAFSPPPLACVSFTLERVAGDSSQYVRWFESTSFCDKKLCQ